jgi:L-ribulose-5-phosphate 3-epimerase
MNDLNRRRFLQVTAAAAGAYTMMAGAPRAQAEPKPMRLGLFVGFESDPEPALQKVHDMGFTACQVSTTDFSDATLAKFKDAVAKYGVEVTALDTSGPGPQIYDFYQGPLTLGFVPRKYRKERVARFKAASDFAKKADIPGMHVHCGYVPPNPNDPVYKEVVETLKDIVAHVKANGQIMLYETGQETPITMLRYIDDVGLDNQFVNLDTANLILYDNGNPVDALDVLGKLVRGVHAKDGLFPTDPKKLGEEVPIGSGKVDFPKVISRLRELGYTNSITIERETSGPEQIADVKKEKAYLENLIG